MIIPYTQNPYLTFGTMQFIVRSNVETSALLTQIQRAIAAVPEDHFRHLRERLDARLGLGQSRER